MTLLTDAPAVLGHQHPRIAHFPHPPGESGQEAVELAAYAGLVLDPWQELILRHGLAESPARLPLWAVFEVAELVSRQNGKGGIIEARELAGLFLFDEWLLLHTAHEYKTAAEHFRRLLGLIEGRDDLRRKVKQVWRSHGEEGIELRDGRRLRFIARTGGSGRGFTGDLLVFDEAQNLGNASVAASMPALSARPNPQIWYAATAPDYRIAPCEQLARLRKRGQLGDDPELVWAEWSIEPHDEYCKPGCTAHDDPAEPAAWAKANPGLGIRITVEHVARERRSMDPDDFARERLGVGVWPPESQAWEVITQTQWDRTVDEASEAGDPVCFAADTTPELDAASIAVAGRRADGAWHVEVVEARPGIGWVIPRLRELTEAWDATEPVLDTTGPAGALATEADQNGLTLYRPSAKEMAQWCGQFYAATVTERTLRQLGIRARYGPALYAAVASARQRKLGEGWAWSRTSSTANITPLVAATLALGGHATLAHRRKRRLRPMARYAGQEANG